MKKGRIDAYYGNVIIEFENSLKSTEAIAKEQLREYASGVWSKEGQPFRALLCVATDGIEWKAFLPRHKQDQKRAPRPDEIVLEPFYEVTLTPDKLREFWIWLTSLLFRTEATNPTAERFSIDFGAMSPAYIDALESLRRAWTEIGKSPEPKLAFETWRNYLAVTYGSVGNESEELTTLFLKHTYLASVARFLVWAALSSGKSSGKFGDIANEILSGEYFRTKGIENLVEDDFFQWVRHHKSQDIMGPIWERIIAQMRTYDLSRIGQDVLKGIYQELVDPKDRHDLGEYYTPDWLCDRIIAELLPSKGFASVLDPSCGSGSFLHAAITHQLESNPASSNPESLKAILNNVVGIDIHPLAVTIAKTTYLLAILPLLKSAKRPVQVPVYLADSLFLPGDVKQYELGRKPGFEVKFGGQSVIIPSELITNAELFDPAINACAKVALDHAKSEKESRKSLARYLEKAVPGLVELNDSEEAITALWDFTETLSRLITKKQNSIWAFIVRNGYRPAMLREKFKYIVGNPPWLSYRYIADPNYQAEIKFRAVDQYAIAPTSQKLFTQMELATVFLAHSLTTFGELGARLGFVMPRSVLSADQHETLRGRKYRAPFLIDGYWDLKEVAPVFSVPTCVLFATKTKEQPAGTMSYTIPATEWSGHLQHRDVGWAQAKTDLKKRETNASLIYIGKRNALSTSSGSTEPSLPSEYLSRFNQGATIVPRSFYFVRIQGLTSRIDPDKLYSAETDPEQAKLAKKPYDDVVLKGQVEGRFIFLTSISKHVLPFVMLNPAPVVLPLSVTHGKPLLVSVETMRKQGFREFAKWMGKAEEIWATKRGDKAGNQSIYERLDYNRGLTSQIPNALYIVLYNAAGTDVCATRVDTSTMTTQFVNDHTLYRADFQSEEEADFLTGILNSNPVNELIKPFQSMGLQGERHVHKKVLELPIPLYKSIDKLHVRLAELSKEAHRSAAAFVVTATLQKSLARQRAAMRNHLKGTMDEIDVIVEKILGR
ncbi:MAG: N-6 DNA methylase [bacterium]|nr:N-6 DNA methylase [bacterium]